MLKIRSSISWRLKAAFICLGFLQVQACGFRPLYSGAATENAVSGQQLIQATSSVFIDDIPERTGQILRQVLSDHLTPLGEPENPEYRLSVRISKVSTSEQAVRKDNLATRYLMTMTAKYVLYSYPENRKLMSSNFTERSNYDVQQSPYATDMAEQAAKERLARIMGNNVALRVAAFLKGYKDPRKTQTEAEEIPEDESADNEEKQPDTDEVSDEELTDTEETAVGEEETDEEDEPEENSSDKGENATVSDESETAAKEPEQTQEP